MIVFDLRCGKAHVFEAWFGSTADYDAQTARGLVACPICDDTRVAKAVMAPAVPAKSNRAVSPAVVKAALGHASIRSTEVYAHATRENVEAALREVDGPPRLRLADLRKEYEGRVAA